VKEKQQDVSEERKQDYKRKTRKTNTTLAQTKHKSLSTANA